MNGGNVLPPVRKTFRPAMADIIRDLKTRHRLTNDSLAEELGCCADTISNVENEHNDLNIVTFLRLWWRFGDEAVRPVTDLACRIPERLTSADRIDDVMRQLSTLRKIIGDQ